ncbi:hypothetical protein HKD24_06100 [Gluconobacter sp. LMG 31484]|uniref:Uncharacterized protein n=1 Tax=Gluconobacter vitians TaxID=2728102 RepID=A0ABR9Y4C3_9PROT|nr:hypothetical protein [Gluconobacter vitians]MBF0858784.1 hypothetical protein [Gluconobacter vitians]
MNLRLIGLSAIALLFTGTALAQAPVQTRGGGIQGQATNSTWKIGPDGIAHFAALDPTTVIGGQNLGDIMAQVNAAVAGVQNAVTKDLVNNPNGVAGLNAAGSMAEPVAAGPLLGGAAIPSVRLGLDPQAVDPTTKQPFLFGGNSDVYLGGYPQPNLAGSPLGYWAAFPVNLIVGGSPSGPYNAGCSLCVYTDASFQNKLVAALSGDDYSGGYVSSGFDVAAFFASAGTQNARLALPVASYTKNTVVLSTALTPDQLLHVKQGMFISTNSLVPGRGPTVIGDAQLPVKDYYAGIVQSVSSDGLTITVYGWAATGTQSAGDVPSTTSLESYYWQNYTTPYVFIGAPTKMFGRNTYMTYDGSRTGDTGQPATSSVRQFEGEEMDFNTSNADKTPDHSVSFHGWTLGGSNMNPNILTSESYGLLLADSLPNYLEIADACGSNAIDSGGYHLPGGCMLGTALNNKAEAFEYNLFANGNNMHWGMWLNRETDASSGWTTTSLNLGGNVDGTKGSLGSSGSAIARLVWGYQGNTGGLDVVTNTGADALRVTNDRITVPGVQVNGTIYYYPTSGSAVQAHIASDANGILYLQSDNGGHIQIEGDGAATGNFTASSLISTSTSYFRANAYFQAGTTSQAHIGADSGGNLYFQTDNGGHMKFNTATDFAAPVTGTTITGGNIMATAWGSTFNGLIATDNIIVQTGKSLDLQGTDTAGGTQPNSAYVTNNKGWVAVADYNSAGQNGYTGFADTAEGYASLPATAPTGARAFCTDCYSTANTNKTLGISVNFNGTKWVDALGYAPGH